MGGQVTRYALIAALCGLLGLGAALWWVSGQRDDARAQAARLQAELDTAQARLDQAAQAAAVHRAFIDRARAEAAKAAATENEFLGKEGGDEPLSDYLRDALDRVR